MADLLNKVAKFWGPDVRVMYGSFTTANTAAPTVLDQRGCAITRAAAGRFTITGISPCRGQTLIISQGGTTAQLAIERVAGNDPTTGVVQISVVTAGGSTEVDTTGVTVSFVVIQRMER